MNAEEQIKALGLELPPPKPGGVYQPLLIHDGLAYVSGHGPLLPDETYLTGKREVNWVWMRGGCGAANRAGNFGDITGAAGQFESRETFGKIFRYGECHRGFWRAPASDQWLQRIDGRGVRSGVGTRSAIDGIAGQYCGGNRGGV